VNSKHVLAIIEAMFNRAVQKGDVHAATVFLNRVLGKVADPDRLETDVEIPDPTDVFL